MNRMKECPSCGEEIKEIAKRCPHCQTWQTKWRFDQTNITHQLIVIFVVFGIASIFFYSAFGNIFISNEFSESRDQIFIENTTLSFAENTCGLQLSLIGTIINQSEFSWKDVYFEAQFFDENDKLIDSISDHDYDLLLVPGFNNSFKITGPANNAKDSYHHYLVLLKDAKENNSLL